jgi:MATE family multidrug resistance protein
MMMGAELRAMTRLALPVILSELGWIMMGIVDTIMVGPLGPAALGAVGAGSTIFVSIAIFGMGTLFALDTYVSQAWGAGRVADCHRWLFAGVQLAVALSVVLTAAAVRLPSRRAADHPAVHRAPGADGDAADVLRRVPPLPAGDERRATGDGGSDHGQRDQRAR